MWTDALSRAVPKGLGFGLLAVVVGAASGMTNVILAGWAMVAATALAGFFGSLLFGLLGRGGRPI